MKCPRCGKELEIPGRAYINLESYHPGGGRVLVSSRCCGYGIWLGMEPKFTIDPYVGEKKEDDWGEKIRTIYVNKGDGSKKVQ